MNSIDKLTEHFMGFPGIGPRQAARFSHFLLTRGATYRRELASLIERLGDTSTVCEKCHRFFTRRRAPDRLCNVCADETRDSTLLMIVEKDVDLETMERSGAYRGLYFVLGGSIPILEKEPERKVRTAELLRRVREPISRERLKEIILALSLTGEGEHTAEYLCAFLAPTAGENGVRISTLGRGLSTGLELEYSDSETLRHAFERRVAWAEMEEATDTERGKIDNQGAHDTTALSESSPKSKVAGARAF